MKRRDFLKATLAAFVSAMTPLEQKGQEKGEALVLNGFVAEEENYLHYAVAQGVLTFDDGIVGMLFQDFVMSLRVGKKEGPPTPIVECTFSKLVAPTPVSTVFFHRLGDHARSKDVTLKLGVVKSDGTPLWFEVKSPLICEVGMSVTTVNEKPTEGMMITEFVRMSSYSEPQIAEKPTITPTPISEEMLKEANPDWPNVIDLREHLVDAWRQYDRNKV